MPTSCSVCGCSNRFCKEKKIQFFAFPVKDEHRLAAWIIAVHRKDRKPTKASKICSAHFRPQDFLQRPGTAWYPYIRGLKNDFVPSVLSNFSECSGSNRAGAKNKKIISAIVKRELEYSAKVKANFIAPEVCSNRLMLYSNKLNSYIDESNVRTKEDTEEIEHNFTESEKDQTIVKLRNKICMLKHQIIKRDRTTICMKELILRP